MTPNTLFHASAWSHVPQADELTVLQELQSAHVAASDNAPGGPRRASSSGLLLLCAASDRLEETVDHALAQDAQGMAVLLRTPATPQAPFARRLLEHHDALAFWLQGDALVGTMYTYFGPEVWRFAKLFQKRAAVFLRGRGATGPWNSH